MKIIHFSDPHAGGPAEDWLAYVDKRWVGVFNYRFRRKFRHDISKLRKAVEYILDVKPDAAVCTGDLTSTGQPGEFELVRPVLEPLRNSTIPLFYLPGNHDCYVKRPKCVRAVNEMVEYLSRGDYRFAELPLVRGDIHRLKLRSAQTILYGTEQYDGTLMGAGFNSSSDARRTSNTLPLKCKVSPAKGSLKSNVTIPSCLSITKAS